jgi:hypothetical protein
MISSSSSSSSSWSKCFSFRTIAFSVVCHNQSTCEYMADDFNKIKSSLWTTKSQVLLRSLGKLLPTTSSSSMPNSKQSSSNSASPKTSQK